MTDCDERTSLLQQGIHYDRKKVLKYRTLANVIKLFAAVVYEFL
jgi:hypothetical protein